MGDEIQNGRVEFHDMEEASAFMERTIDREVETSTRELAGGARLSAFPLSLAGDQFANVYDLSWPGDSLTAKIHTPAHPVPVTEVALANQAAVAVSGAFFFLADTAAARPAMASLNLAIAAGRIRNMPVTDREALVCAGGRLSLAYIPARGRLTLNGRLLAWEGSRTGRVADCYVYGNGNAVIKAAAHPVTGKARVFDESSRWTPSLPPAARWVDVALRATGPEFFVSEAVTDSGRVDIFAHDLVLRCPAALVNRDGVNTVRIETVGPFIGGALPDTALSVGPSLGVPGLDIHPINGDLSMGDNAGFASRRLARLMAYATTDGRTHLRLFDGRPGSRRFAGVTPDEATAAVSALDDVVWGCFLDGGQTAKIAVRQENGTYTTYGNRHYLRWPGEGEQTFRWTPEEGRPVGSVITLS